MRIILADHHAGPRWALRLLLTEQTEFEFLGDAVDADGLLMLAEKHLAHLFLIDRDLPGMPIEDLIARLHAFEPRPIVVVMSSEFEHSRALLKAGADAFVSKGDESGWLLETLHKYAKQVAAKEDTNRYDTL
jgi:DNA-binding NarL/FixJ family response regulator